MEDDYTGGDICIDGSTDCIGNDIVYGSRTDIHLKNKPRPSGRGFNCVEGTSARKNSNKIWFFTRLIVPLTSSNPLTLDIAQASLALFSLNRGFLIQEAECPEWNFPSRG